MARITHSNKYYKKAKSYYQKALHMDPLQKDCLKDLKKLLKDIEIPEKAVVTEVKVNETKKKKK